MAKDDNRIGDLPSVRALSSAVSAAKVLGQLAQLTVELGLSSESAVEISKSADELLAQADILMLPDRFNAVFADRGWFATPSMSIEAMQGALQRHDEGGSDAGEEVLLGWILDPETLKLFALNRSKRFYDVHGRWHQLQEALALTEEGRYWAAVPLILIVCDGFASELLGTSPFEKNADLSLFDSMVAHPSSLPAAIALITKGVRKTSEDVLSLPMRHGILHGRSLGYANRTTCGKAWMLMIGLVDWAADKTEEEARRGKEAERLSTDLSDVVALLRKTEADKAAIRSFVSRNWTIFSEVDLDGNDPPFAFREFLEAWRSRNFGVMAKRAVNMTRQKQSQLAGRLRADVELVKLVEYDMVSVSQVTVARAEARVRLLGETMKGKVEGEFLLLAFKHTEDGDVAMPTDQGSWQIQQGCIYDLLNERTVDTR